MPRLLEGIQKNKMIDSTAISEKRTSSLALLHRSFRPDTLSTVLSQPRTPATAQARDHGKNPSISAPKR